MLDRFSLRTDRGFVVLTAALCLSSAMYDASAFEFNNFDFTVGFSYV